MKALEKIDRWQAAPTDLEAFTQIVEAASLTVGDVRVACSDVRHEDDELVIELEVRLPVRKPVQHHIPGFHGDVTGV